jgi:uncharacterized protein (DUF983 family)
VPALWRAGVVCGLGEFCAALCPLRARFRGVQRGDGPAAFLTLLIGALACVVAGWMALTIDPPWWVYVVALGPATLGLIVWGLRAGKAALLAVEYRRRAGEHRIDS